MAKRTDSVQETPGQISQEQLRKENEYIIKNKRVRRQTRRRAIVIILLVFLLIISILAGAAYAIMQFVDESQFRVSVTHTGTAWLSLSKDYNFTNPTSVLDVAAPQSMDNCTLCNYLDHKLLEISNTNGAYKGEGSKDYYIATTFYLKNSGKTEVSYCESITLDRTLRGMEKAIRVLMIKDIDPPEDESLGTITVYAAPKDVLEDGTVILEEVVPLGGELLSESYKPKGNAAYDGFDFDPDDILEDGTWMTKPFAGDGYVMHSEYYPLDPNAIIKYTIVIWLEGQDAECVDDILGGQVKIAVEFSVQN